MEELSTSLLGKMTAPIFIAAMIFAFLGWTIFKLVTAGKRDPDSKRTPELWDWNFWVQDNWKEFILTGVAMYIFVRFAPEILSYFMPDAESTFTQKYDAMFIYFVMGLLLSKGLNIIKNKLKDKNES